MSNALSFHYLRRPEVQKACGGLSRSGVEELVAQGILPKPYRLGARTTVWRSDELEEALASLPKVANAYERSVENRKARQAQK